jgi:hypothetical protein
MPQNVFENPASDNECLNYIRPSNKTQRITSFAARTTITLANPQRVINNVADAAVIYIKLRGDPTLYPYGFNGYQERVLDVVQIGSSADGTTSTDVIVTGIS